jgi:hypothetical protein
MTTPMMAIIYPEISCSSMIDYRSGLQLNNSISGGQLQVIIPATRFVSGNEIS